MYLKARTVKHEFNFTGTTTAGTYEFPIFKLAVGRAAILKSIIVFDNSSKFPMVYLRVHFKTQGNDYLGFSGVATPAGNGHCWYKDLNIVFDWQDSIIVGVITNVDNAVLRYLLTYEEVYR